MAVDSSLALTQTYLPAMSPVRTDKPYELPSPEGGAFSVVTPAPWQLGHDLYTGFISPPGLDESRT